MKKLFCFFLLFPFFGYCQPTFRTLPDSDAIWMMTDNSFTSDKVFFIPPTNWDTTIGTFNYSKIFESDVFSAGPNYVGCYRSLQNGISYYIPKDSMFEFVLMDLNAQVGDTVNNVYFKQSPPGPSPVVANITVANTGFYTAGSINLRYILLNTPHGGIEWIEHIGNIFGIDNYASEPLAPWDVTCMSAIDTTWYSNGTVVLSPSQTCQLDLGINIQQSPTQIKISPNPFTNEFMLENIPQECEVILFDGMGRKVWEENASHDNRIFVPENLNAGLYFLQIRNKDGQILWREKMVRE